MKTFENYRNFSKRLSLTFGFTILLMVSSCLVGSSLLSTITLQLLTIRSLAMLLKVKEMKLCSIENLLLFFNPVKQLLMHIFLRVLAKSKRVLSSILEMTIKPRRYSLKFSISSILSF